MTIGGSTVRHGLHLLGVDSEKKDSEKKTDYAPYLDAATALTRGITEGLRSPPPPPPPPPPEESNTVWYVAGAAAVVAVVVALLVMRK